MPLDFTPSETETRTLAQQMADALRNCKYEQCRKAYSREDLHGNVRVCATTAIGLGLGLISDEVLRSVTLHGNLRFGVGIYRTTDLMVELGASRGFILWLNDDYGRSFAEIANILESLPPNPTK